MALYSYGFIGLFGLDQVVYARGHVATLDHRYSSLSSILGRGLSYVKGVVFLYTIVQLSSIRGQGGGLAIGPRATQICFVCFRDFLVNIFLLGGYARVSIFIASGSTMAYQVIGLYKGGHYNAAILGVDLREVLGDLTIRGQDITIRGGSVTTILFGRVLYRRRDIAYSRSFDLGRTFGKGVRN